MTNKCLVDVVDNLNLPSNEDNQRLKPHTLRAIYAISAWKLYATNTDLSLFIKKVLCHKSDSAALRYKVISLDTAVRVQPPEFLDQIDALRAEFTNLKKEVDEGLLENKLEADNFGKIKIINTAGQPKFYRKRKRIKGQPEQEKLDEMTDILVQFQADDVRPSGDNFKKLGFGQVTVNLWKKEYPEFNLHPTRRRRIE